MKFNAKSLKCFVNSGKKWAPYNKGGSYRKWYGNYDYIVNWENNGAEIKNFIDDKGKVRSRPQNIKHYFFEALTWSEITSSRFSLRYREYGSIHGNKGMSAFSTNHLSMMNILAVVNSKVGDYILNILNPTISLGVGDFKRFPIKVINSIDIDKISENLVDIYKKDWDSYELSWNFNRHPLLKNIFKDNILRQSIKDLEQDCVKNIEVAIENEEYLNVWVINEYGLNSELSYSVNSSDVGLRKGTTKSEIKSFISYSMGVIFGRYSIDEDGLIYAGGEWDPSRYQKFKPDADNVLLITDDEYFKDSQIDIVNRFIDFVEITFGKETLEENLQFIADTLGGKGTSREIIRRYFVKDFYKDHLKTYSNRPIYWQLDSGKQNGFKALMYLHRYTPDQLGKVRTEYLHELQKAYDNRIELRQQQISTSDNPKERNAMTKEIAKIQKQLKEVREYDEKLGHLALKRIELDLDDGVIVNYDKLQRDPKTGEKFQILAKGVKEPKK
ncbi:MULTISPECIES: BREX-1 system adenine-specific DNA-methyltransferase PglX [Enterococcus]|uniref:BREX-1 system adenine-specific DNA-methyltransferase PglX n=1 Tax=Enterococcus TaxID=1350 RepID=UPI0011EA641B|nr:MULTISPECIES: BREX-1 system adenine-specific DNA-methyltransferase PglX [Enterococcus]MEB4620947.1 BREX-1 system adenine-specific DNA-methyltransferase PglX [Enterococcus sp. E4-223]